MSADRPDITGLAWGAHRRPCPHCDRGPRDRALSVHVAADSGVWHCHRCGWSGHWRGDGAVPARAPTPARPSPAVRETLSPVGLALWAACDPIAGAAAAYLAARGCVTPPADGDLRWHPRLRHPSGHVGPALVGLVTHAETGAPMSLHRTWIGPDGRKADVDPPRLLLARHRARDGVIRLWPSAALAGELAVGEGVETCLAAAQAVTPVWSCIDAGNLSRLPVLDGIERLLVLVDHDAAGLRAAQLCVARWQADGRDVRLVVPPEPGTDVADYAGGAS
ncbi:MAG: DUF7146 domain-containing protein [Pseudomonadota bacterium]